MPLSPPTLSKTYLDHEVRPVSSGAVVKFRFVEGGSQYLYFAGAKPHPEHPTQLLIVDRGTIDPRVYAQS